MTHPGKKNRIDAFSAFCIAVALLVVLMIGSAVFAVLAAGFPRLPEALSSPEIWFSLRLSVETGAISTLICMVLALPSAYAFTRTKMPLKRFSEVLLELTMCLPYIVLGFCLLMLFSSDFGKWLKALGFKVVFDCRGIVIAQLFVNLPFALRMLRTALLQVDTRLEMIVGMLGASRWKQLVTITLPLCRNALISTVILTWSRAVGEFGATLMLVGVTRMKTETLPGSIFLNISTGDNDMAMAAATLMLLIAGIALALTNRLNHPPRYYRLSTGGKT